MRPEDLRFGVMKGPAMTMRAALILLAVCAGFATAAPAQDSASVPCGPSGDLAPAHSDKIWAFD